MIDYSHPEVDALLLEAAHEFRLDPYAFVMFAWDWENDEKPYEWQTQLLKYIAKQLKSGEVTTHDAIRIAVTSGHGCGKSSLVSWMLLWSMVTAPDTKGVVTANTENQLKTKTWAELSKWYNKCRYKHWFTFNATSLCSTEPDKAKTWRIDMIPWSEKNTEAFAGLHNKGKRIIVVFDESSAIPDTIWEVTEGALTDEDTEIMWLCFGNPTRNSGRLRECFRNFKHRWKQYTVDSRTVPGTNKKQIAEWQEDFGEDSDFFKIRVRGLFPSAAVNQFIDENSVRQCFMYRSMGHEALPIIIGVDPARFGDDASVLRVRQGRRVWPKYEFRGLDTNELADRVIDVVDKFDADHVVVDATGVGAGVFDKLKSMGYGDILVEFHGANEADNKDAYLNRRAESWGLMRAALKSGMQIDPDEKLLQELTAPSYSMTNKNQIKIESKDSMKNRGQESPNDADALAMTFSIRPRKKPKPKYYNIPEHTYHDAGVGA